MTAPDARDNEFLDLMFDLAEDRLSPPQTARLEELLQADPARRRQYVDFMLIVSGLHRIRGEGQEAGGLGSGSSRLGIRDFTFPSSDSPGKSPEPQSPDSEPLIAPIIIQTSPDLPSPFFPLSSSLSDWLLSYAAATVIVGAAILGAWAYKVSLEAGTDILPVQVADTGKVPGTCRPDYRRGRLPLGRRARGAVRRRSPGPQVRVGLGPHGNRL
jgi:hypothetical protein